MADDRDRDASGQLTDDLGGPPTASASGETPAPPRPNPGTTVADLAPEAGARDTPPDAALPREEPDPTNRTVGTGSVFAIGCVAAAVAIILIGVLVALVSRV